MKKSIEKVHSRNWSHGRLTWLIGRPMKKSIEKVKVINHTWHWPQKHLKMPNFGSIWTPMVSIKLKKLKSRSRSMVVWVMVCVRLCLSDLVVYDGVCDVIGCSSRWSVSMMVAQRNGWSLSTIVAQLDGRSAWWLLSTMVTQHNDHAAEWSFSTMVV